ncbi:MAG TPA: hypothetical protein VHX38_39680 [Pseudonocardiaceae bacterium]|jgi:hypothetical protein|nr:hypothetical protein [Pseudonocardiaceae bacterium]
MLLLALLFVLAALGLLVLALVTSAMLWAWVSVVASVVATALLIADWWRRRHLPAAEPDRAVLAAPEPAARAAATAPEPASMAEQDEPDAGDPQVEPAEEDTDAADVLVVSELDAEVLVLDERPRYHLAGCRWVGERATLPLSVREARQLGFNPCAVCTPDAILAARHRAASS